MAFTIDPAVAARNAEHQRQLEARAFRVGSLRNRLSEMYPPGTGITLEIGCGHGHFLTAYAQRHPGKACLGIDLLNRRIEKAEQKRSKRALGNLHFLKAEVTEFLEAWPRERGLERCFILFPDPWPKKRHLKNRILQPALLEALAALATPGAALHFRTDHEGCFEWGLEQIRSHPRWEIRAGAPWPFENASYFQELAGSYRSLSAAVSPLPGDGA
ncbi:MAG: tRNA (guanosine(46)-N7)-methyltransferase TrmB [Oceanipulchritudo sp.]